MADCSSRKAAPRPGRYSIARWAATSNTASSQSTRSAANCPKRIGQTLAHVRLANVLENIFTWNGAIQHEIVFVFTAALADQAAYEIPEQLIRDTAAKTRVIWRAADATSPPLYPVGIADTAASGRATARS